MLLGAGKKGAPERKGRESDTGGREDRDGEAVEDAAEPENERGRPEDAEPERDAERDPLEAAVEAEPSEKRAAEPIGRDGESGDHGEPGQDEDEHAGPLERGYARARRATVCASHTASAISKRSQRASAV